MKNIKTFAEDLETLTDNDWNKLFSLKTEIERTEKFGEGKGGMEIKDGVREMPYVDWAPVVHKFFDVVHDIELLPDFPWTKWTEGKEFLNNKEQDFDKLDAVTLCKLFAVIIRKDRFHDGLLVSCFEDGTILRIIKALENKVVRKANIMEYDEELERRIGELYNEMINNPNFAEEEMWRIYDDEISQLKNNKMEKETHEYVNKYPLEPMLNYLIIGTIHPNKKYNHFTPDYYYGNTRDLWKIIKRVYPDSSFETIEEIINWEKTIKIGLTDTILKCNRIDDKSANDNTLIDIEYNPLLKNYVLENKTSLKKLLFTSKVARHYFEELMGSELEQFKDICTNLPSPSGNATRSFFKGKDECFGLIPDFYEFLKVEYPDALEMVKSTFEPRCYPRLPKGINYFFEYKVWFYKQHFPQKSK